MKKLFALTLLLVASSYALGQETEIYVSDAGNFNNPPWQILKFDAKGENPEVFINNNLNWPQDIVFLDDFGTVLISNLGTDKITRHNAQTGAYINDFATSIDGPTRMKIGEDGLLYVLQWNGDGKVLRYQLDGSFVGEFTNVGVNQSIGIDWDSDGNLYVSSFRSGSVRKFDTNGNDAGLFINSNLAGPTNIWFDDSGDLLVSDYSARSIKRFDSNGVFLGNFITGLSQSEGVAMFANGNILIGNGSSKSVKMFDSEGNYIEDLIPRSSAGLIAPNAVVIRNDSAFNINAGLNDAWFNPLTDGQGFFITVFPDLGSVFLAWFTFDTALPAEGETANLGYSGHRWLTAFGHIEGNSVSMNIAITRDGLFNNNRPVQNTDPTGSDGTITLTFESCASAVVEYDITSINQQGSVPIQRIANDNIALCESLNLQ
jgi:hypothetical protein